MGVQQLLVGIGGVTVAITDKNLVSSRISPADALCSYQLTSAGDVNTQEAPGANTDVGDWVTPKSAAPGPYFVRATLNSGTLDASSSATGTDLALTSTRTWLTQVTGIGTQNANLTIEIKLGSGGPVLATATVTLSSDVSV